MGNATVHKRVKGKGSPPVVFINGFQDDLEAWDFRQDFASHATRKRFYASELGTGIQTPVSEWTATLSFDWPGSGKSRRNLDLDSPEKEVAFVEQVILSAGLKPPCVFVGHSIGCITALTILTFRPGLVAGIVLIDPMPFDKYCDYMHRDGFDELKKQAPNGVLRIAQAVSAIPQFDMKSIKETDRIAVHFNIDDDDEAKENREEMARVIKQQYSNVTIHRNKTHHIHLHAPDVIIDSIRRMYDTVQNQHNSTSRSLDANSGPSGIVQKES